VADALANVTTLIIPRLNHRIHVAWAGIQPLVRDIGPAMNAALEEMVGTRRNANDADSLVVAMTDPESRARAGAYLRQRGR
jgi:hypothetical protein